MYRFLGLALLALAYPALADAHPPGWGGSPSGFSSGWGGNGWGGSRQFDFDGSFRLRPRSFSSPWDFPGWGGWGDPRFAPQQFNFHFHHRRRFFRPRQRLDLNINFGRGW